MKATILIDDDVKGDLEREASRTGSHPSTLAEQAISSFLDSRARKRNAVAEALRDAEAGLFVSREAVDLWVQTWDATDDAEPPHPDILPPTHR